MLVLKQGRELAHKLCLINAAGTLLITIGVQHNPLAADFNDLLQKQPRERLRNSSLGRQS